MKKRDVVVDKRYTAKVSGKFCTVRVLRESQYGGWDCLNESTGREIRVKSAQCLRPTLRDVLDAQHKARMAALEAAKQTETKAAETSVRCSHCGLDVEVVGDLGNLAIATPGNHEPVKVGGFAMPSETPVCPGSEMLGHVHQE